jgi:hypothetical protein
MAQSKRGGAKPRCEDCFFHQNMLCALGLKEACPTFRPAHPDGLRPPQQLSFVFRQDGRGSRAPLPEVMEGAARGLGFRTPALQ